MIGINGSKIPNNLEWYCNHDRTFVRNPAQVLKYASMNNATYHFEENYSQFIVFNRIQKRIRTNFPYYFEDINIERLIRSDAFTP